MLVRGLISILAPRTCYGCNRPGTSLCLECLKRYVEPRQPHCFECQWGWRLGTTCLSCAPDVSLVGTVVATRYTGLVRTLMRRLKQSPDVRIAELFGKLLARRIMHIPVRPTLITFMPTSPGRYRERGYNPAELIARTVARELVLPCRPTLLRLTTKHQMGLDRMDRRSQIAGAFVMRGGAHVRGETIVIIDDVMTTGASLNEAARELTESGANWVWGAAVARR